MPRDWRETNPAPAARFDRAAPADWSDLENSDPFADIAAGIEVFRHHNGHPPDKLVISPRLRDELLRHPLVLERLRHVDPRSRGNPALLAQLFDVADVIVT
jgi:hypothetical protein